MSNISSQDSAGATVNPSKIMELSVAYWGSQTLFAANRLGIFELLDSLYMTARQVSESLGTDQHRTRLLLKSCVALELLVEEGDRFGNSPMSKAFLVPGKPHFFGNAIHYSDQMAAPWADLERSVREGVPTLPAEDYLGRDESQTRHFVYGMHERALGIGQALISLIDLSECRQMLDIGGGPGTYSALFTKRFRSLRSTVLELPGIAAVAAEILESMGAQETVSLLKGDFHTTPFPGGNDAVLCSGILHRESEDNCRSLLRRATEALNPGGLLIVSDVFADSGGTSPTFAALFGLNMAVSAPDGGVHADDDMANWMTEVGIEEIESRHFPAPLPHRVLLGRKIEK